VVVKIWHLAVVAALVAVAGFWFLTRSEPAAAPASTVSAADQQSRVAPEQALAAAQANVSAAIPALAAWFADNGTYAGVTGAALQQYAPGVTAVDVPYATANEYCVESVFGTVAAHLRGPGGSVEAGRC
jgi:hypothetical protein